MVIDARAEVGGNFLAGVATDEFDPDGEIDALAKKLAYAVENGYVQPANFYGIGGMKIFRDLIWLMQGMMKADHKFYKAHNQYDFPQKKRGRMLAMYLVGGLMGNEKLKSKMGNKMNEMKGGSFKCAVKAKAPIVPCALIDSFVPFDGNSIRKVTVKIFYLKPMYYDEYKDMSTLEIAAEVRRRIEETIAANT